MHAMRPSGAALGRAARHTLAVHSNAGAAGIVAPSSSQVLSPVATMLRGARAHTCTSSKARRTDDIFCQRCACFAKEARIDRGAS